MKLSSTATLLSLILLLVSAGPRDLSAQLWQAGPPGDDLFTFSLQAGLFSPQTEYPDDSTFDSGTAIGGSFTYWPLGNIGIRTHVTRSATEGVHEGELVSPIEVEDPVQWIYGLEGVLRLPMQGQSISWFPYVAGGVGLKSYRWEAYQPARHGLHRDTGKAFTYGGGLEVRFGQSQVLGLVADFRGASSDFVWFGFDEAQSDFLFTGGISVSY